MVNYCLKRSVLPACAVVFGLAAGAAQAQEGSGEAVYAVPRVDVIGVTPLHGTGVAKDKVPANVKVLGGDDMRRNHALDVGSALSRELGSVTANDAQNNPFQRDINVRGYVASPLLGNAQGLAVYMNGARINEGFGEEVQWDLVPEFAVDQIQLMPGANPAYGLNALGGSLSLKMKNGFDNAGTEINFMAGAFGRVRESLEYGVTAGDYAGYIGISRHDEKGWRDHSPSEVTQIFGNVGYRGDRLAASLSMNLATTDLNGNGAAPAGLLDINREAVFTHPDNTRNRLAHFIANASYDLNDSTMLEAMAYYRLLERKTLNGDEFEGEECFSDEADEGIQLLIGAGNVFADEGAAQQAFIAANPGIFRVGGVGGGFNEDRLCAEIEEDELEEFVEEFNNAVGAVAQDAVRAEAAEAFVNAVLIKEDGTPVDTDADTNDEEASAAFNTSETVTNSFGGSLQTSFDRPLFGFDNLLIAGTSVDRSSTNYGNRTQIGELTGDRTVDPFNVFLRATKRDFDRGLFSYTSNIKGDTTAVGVYVSDTIDLTEDLSATLAGRFNWTEVSVQDIFAKSKDVHTYRRFNPSVGLTYQVNNRLGLFTNYSEANRAPSPVELSCADEENPCRVPNAFLADPPLKQVVNRSIEIGARGAGLHSGMTYAWSLAGFAGRNYDDIIFVRAGEDKPVGVGFFQNAGITQRIGAEADFNAHWGQLGFSASYAYIDATFRSHVSLPARELTVPAKTLANNVTPGDRMPGIPKHNVRLGLDYQVTDKWMVGVEGIIASNQVMRGDEGNEAPKVDGYGLMNLRTSYAFNDNVETFLLVENVLDTKYETFGLVGENPTEVVQGLTNADNRFLGPGSPLGIWGGFRVGF